MSWASPRPPPEMRTVTPAGVKPAPVAAVLPPTVVVVTAVPVDPAAEIAQQRVGHLVAGLHLEGARARREG